MATEDGAGPSNDQFAQLLSAIQANQQRVDDQLSEMRAEMRSSQEDAAAKALKHVRHEKPYAYKKKGNEEQAAFNEAVQETIRASHRRGSAGCHEGARSYRERCEATIRAGEAYKDS